MNKIYTYNHLPKKGENNPLENVQYTLTDDVILDYLNRIVKDANRLTAIEYKEISESDKLGEIEITFKIVKEYPDGDNQQTT